MAAPLKRESRNTRRRIACSTADCCARSGSVSDDLRQGLHLKSAPLRGGRRANPKLGKNALTRGSSVLPACLAAESEPKTEKRSLGNGGRGAANGLPNHVSNQSFTVVSHQLNFPNFLRVALGEPNLAIRARPEPRITHTYPSLPICGLWGPPKIPQVRWRSRATCQEAPDLIPCRCLVWRIPLRRPARDIIPQDHVDFDVDEFSRRDAALTRVSSQGLLCDGHSQSVTRFLPPPGRPLRRSNSPCGRLQAISACSP